MLIIYFKVSCGPIGKSVDDLVLMFKSLNDPKSHYEADID